MSAPLSADPVPLCVDMDGTLVRGDIFFLTCLRMLWRKPWLFPQALWWLRKGRPYLKDQISRRVSLPSKSIPLRQGFLSWLRQQADGGRTVLLVTAGNEHAARMVAEAAGVFDEVLASTATLHLKGSRKGAALRERFGENGFDYVGDSRPDFKVWEHARRAYIIGFRANGLAKVLAGRFPDKHIEVLPPD